MKIVDAVRTAGMTPAGRLPHSSILHRDRQQDSAYHQLGSGAQQHNGRLGQREHLQAALADPAGPTPAVPAAAVSAPVLPQG